MTVLPPDNVDGLMLPKTKVELKPVLVVIIKLGTLPPTCTNAPLVIVALSVNEAGAWVVAEADTVAVGLP